MNSQIIVRDDNFVLYTIWNCGVSKIFSKLSHKFQQKMQLRFNSMWYSSFVLIKTLDWEQCSLILQSVVKV